MTDLPYRGRLILGVNCYAAANVVTKLIRDVGYTASNSISVHRHIGIDKGQYVNLSSLNAAIAGSV